MAFIKSETLMAQPFVGAILGQRRSGKTTLLVDLLLSYWRRRFSMIVIVSRTIALQEDVWRRLGGEGVLLYEKLDMQFLRKLKDFMAGSGGPREVLLVCDDIGKIANYFHRQIMGRSGEEDQLSFLAYASRHYNISLLYLAQDLTQMGMSYRKNFDFVICMEASVMDQQLLYIELLSNTFPSASSFRHYYAEHTGDFKFFQLYKDHGRYLVWPPPAEERNRRVRSNHDPTRGQVRLHLEEGGEAGVGGGGEPMVPAE